MASNWHTTDDESPIEPVDPHSSVSAMQTPQFVYQKPRSGLQNIATFLGITIVTALGISWYTGTSLTSLVNIPFGAQLEQDQNALSNTLALRFTNDGFFVEQHNSQSATLELSQAAIAKFVEEKKGLIVTLKNETNQPGSFEILVSSNNADQNDTAQNDAAPVKIGGAVVFQKEETSITVPDSVLKAVLEQPLIALAIASKTSPHILNIALNKDAPVDTLVVANTEELTQNSSSLQNTSSVSSVATNDVLHSAPGSVPAQGNPVEAMQTNDPSGIVAATTKTSTPINIQNLTAGSPQITIASPQGNAGVPVASLTATSPSFSGNGNAQSLPSNPYTVGNTQQQIARTVSNNHQPELVTIGTKRLVVPETGPGEWILGLLAIVISMFLLRKNMLAQHKRNIWTV